MVKTIRFKSEALESVVRSLGSAGGRLEAASSTLNGIHISSGNGANLRPNGLSTTVREALHEYKEALDRTISSLRALSKNTACVKGLFEEGEKSIVHLAPVSEALSSPDDKQNAFSQLPDTALSTALGRAIGDYGRNKTGQYRRDISLAMLEMSGIAYNNQETGWYDRQRLAELGFQNSRFLDPPGAVIAWRINGDGEPVVAIAFRGTTKAADWTVDFLASDSHDGVHMGFRYYTDLLRRQLDSVYLDGIDGTPSLEELIGHASSGEKVNFLITGHSLGGAEAQVFAYDLLREGVPNGSVSAYTFASPQPFTHLGIDAALGNGAHVYNVINNIDFVPHVGAVNDELPPGINLFDNRNIGTDIRAIPTAGEIAENILDSAKVAVEAVFTPPIGSPFVGTWNIVNGSPTAGEIAGNILDSAKEAIFTSPIALPFVGAFNIANGNHSLDTYRKIVERM